MRLFDLHCDTLYSAWKENCPLSDNHLHVDFSRGRRYRPWIQTMAVWIPDERRGAAARELFTQARALLFRELEKTPEILFCRSGSDITRTFREEKSGILLAVEGGAAAEGSLERLDDLYESGVRMMTLTWNGDNELGGGIKGKSQSGLTPFGKQAVKKMEELGMVIDVSHASPALFYDVCEQTEKPFVASHSNVKAVCSHPRNLTDDQISILVQRGGLIGLNFYVSFLREDSKASLDDVYAHAAHILELGGENTLALGSDFDGADMPEALSGIEKLEGLYEYLLGKNIHESLVDKIFFGNAYNFFSKL